MATSKLEPPKRGEMSQVLTSLSPRQAYWFFGALLVAILAVLLILWQVSLRYSITVAASGGSLTEGVIGAPHFINPLLASSDADRDMTTLIYSGLTRVAPSGEIIPDLADHYEISADGLTYTFTLKDNLTWHDGTSLTTADVEFTVLKAQDPLLKSPKRAAWEGVSVTVVSDKVITFNLKQPYPSFLETTTTGILPKHIWSQLETDAFPLNKFNIESVGSGPYQIKNISQNSLGIPEYYDLVPFKKFALGEPKIANLRLRFYPSEDDLVAAFHRGEIKSMSAVSSENAEKLERAGANVLKTPLPRVFGVFFNQNKAPVLANQEVRAALDLALDKQAIIDQVLHGYGLVADGPLPPGTILMATNTPATDMPSQTTSTTTDRVVQAQQLLTKKGWTLNPNTRTWEKKSKKETTPLAFTLSTSDTPELAQAAKLIADAWNKMGAKVDLKIFEIGDLNQNVIRPRHYDALFFGEILGRRPDLFSFWHSSQRLDPGLNIAMYTNTVVDKILDQIRTTNDPETVTTQYQKLNSLIAADHPAVFIYAPYFVYVIPKEIKRVTLAPINTPAERFLNIYEWYLTTDRVWPVFVNEHNKTN